MRALLMVAIVAAMAMVLGATLVWTCYEPSSVSPSFNIPSTGRGAVSHTLASIQPARPQAPQYIQPGACLTNSPLLDTLPKDRGFVLSKPVPLYMDKLPSPPTHLRPGAYQTYPYAMILMVPGRGIDDGILGGKPDTYSKMPRIKPHVEAIPRLFNP